MLCATYPTLAAASLAINASLLLQQAGAPGGPAGGSSLGQLMPQWPSAEPASRIYFAFALVLLAAAVASYVPSVFFLTAGGAASSAGVALGDVSLLLTHTWAPGFWLAAVSCFVLQVSSLRK